jgi:hypothetical protein
MYVHINESRSTGNSAFMPPSRLKQALVNTQVTSGFFIKHTASVDESVDYLVMMTQYITSLCQHRTLRPKGLRSLNEVGLDMSQRFREGARRGGKHASAGIRRVSHLVCQVAGVYGSSFAPSVINTGSHGARPVWSPADATSNAH